MRLRLRSRSTRCSVASSRTRISSSHQSSLWDAFAMLLAPGIGAMSPRPGTGPAVRTPKVEPNVYFLEPGTHGSNLLSTCGDQKGVCWGCAAQREGRRAWKMWPASGWSVHTTCRSGCIRLHSVPRAEDSQWPPAGCRARKKRSGNVRLQFSFSS